MARIWIDEYDALEKYCPFRAKKVDYEDELPTEEANEFCRSSDCMAWAWRDADKKDKYGGTCLLIPPMED